MQQIEPGTAPRLLVDRDVDAGWFHADSGQLVQDAIEVRPRRGGDQHLEHAVAAAGHDLLRRIPQLGGPKGRKVDPWR